MPKSKIWRGLLCASALTAFSSGSAFAQNNFTPAETDVSNTFSLSYNVGTVPQPPITNDGVGGNDAPTVFRVDRLVNVTVASSGTPGAFSPNQQNASVEFSVRNDGNDTHAYLLDFEEDTGDNFDTDASTSGDRIVYFVDANGDGVLDAGELASETSYDPANDATWPVLAPDDSIIVRVVRDIPATAIDGEQADIHLFADTRDETDPSGTAIEADTDTVNSTLVTENVLADADGPASAGNDTGTDGAHSATNSFVVLAADVTATKDVFVVSEVPCVDIPAGAYTPPADNAGNYSIPNACVEYVITVENDGTAAATAIDLLDELPDNLLFRDAAILGDLTGTFSPALPAQGTECTSSPVNCAINVSAGSIPGKAAPGDAPNVGYLVIRATIK